MFCCAFGLLDRARGDMRGRARGHNGMNTFVRLMPARMRHLGKTNLHSHPGIQEDKKQFSPFPANSHPALLGSTTRPRNTLPPIRPLSVR